jgi:uncharacterized protein
MNESNLYGVLMNIDVKKKLNRHLSEVQQVVLDERLPEFVADSFPMNFQYQIEDRGEFYLMKLKEFASVPAHCQRCGERWLCDYQNEVELAICPSEQVAEKYQSLYDVIVVPDLILDIKDVLIDNMHLFLPNKHLEVEKCNQDQLKLMQNV